MPDLDGPVKLEGLFRELAAKAPAPNPGLVETRLRAGFRARRQGRRMRVVAGSLAACLLAVFAWEWQSSNERAVAEQPGYRGFFALPYAQSDVPMEQVIVVRVNLQAADLTALGLSPGLLSGRNKMQADLLIGQDGVARAVRFAE